MARMIDLIRQSAVPANLMRTAARGALALPASEMAEILVYLAAHPIFGQQARMTLAAWDESSSLALAADATTPAEVLAYLIAPRNVRPPLLPALLENSSIFESQLLTLAQVASQDLVHVMVASARVRRSSNILRALETNPALDVPERESVASALHALSATQLPASSNESADPLSCEEPSQYELDHAAEIAAEEGKPFELVRGDSDEEDELAQLLPVIQATASSVPSARQPAAQAPVSQPAPVQASPAHVTSAPVVAAEPERISTLQKIARLAVGERVQLAMKGTRDERFILVRDGSKVVCVAVLESPKLTDSEVETFAAMKNVQEAVLRSIAGKRKFLKNYAVIRALVNNPRVPFDITLPLISHLLANDLKNLSMNKNISDTLRKLALKQFKDKTESRKS
ncbi:MAG TPA: hypothetical protein VN622_15635 [Clostridia bacterium]|nr:hypothetical protein [Clostridia bacterium]